VVKTGISTSKKSDQKKKKNFILNSAQDFFSRLASRATMQNLKIGLVRSLSIVHSQVCSDWFK
jgi:hypothetical protein